MYLSNVCRSSDSNDVIWALSWMAQERPELLKKVSSKLPVTLEERTKVFIVLLLLL